MFQRNKINDYVKKMCDEPKYLEVNHGIFEQDVNLRTEILEHLDALLDKAMHQRKLLFQQYVTLVRKVNEQLADGLEKEDPMAAKTIDKIDAAIKKCGGFLDKSREQLDLLNVTTAKQDEKVNKWCQLQLKLIGMDHPAATNKNRITP